MTSIAFTPITSSPSGSSTATYSAVVPPGTTWTRPASTPMAVSRSTSSQPAGSAPTAVSRAVRAPSRASDSATFRATPPRPESEEAMFEVPSTAGPTSRKDRSTAAPPMQRQSIPIDADPAA